MSDDQPTVREEITVMKNDIGWIKRAVFGLYALLGSLLVAFLISLSQRDNPVHTAALIAHWLGGLT